MTEEQTPIKIVIPVEDETPFVPERPRPDVKASVRQAGRQVLHTTGKATKRAWRSRARKKATGGIKRGAKTIAAAGGRVVHSTVVKTSERHARKRAAAVRTHIESTDWKHEARTGTGKGLRWLSQRLARLAERLAPPSPRQPESKDELG